MKNQKWLKCLLIWESEKHGSVIACKDGKFRSSVTFGTCRFCCKFWKREVYARKFAEKARVNDYKIVFIYDGDTIDHLGNVAKGRAS